MEGSKFIRMAALFDFEEIGSRQRAGAGGSFLPSVIAKIVGSLKPKDKELEQVLSGVIGRSFMISADVTHAYNPNFPQAYVTNARPKLNVGVTVSTSGSARMATEAQTTAIMQLMANKSEPKSTLQVFEPRNDTTSGSTIGTILGAILGIRGVDAGIAQLAMHSVRALVGADDPYLCVVLFTAFYKEWEKMQENNQ